MKIPKVGEKIYIPSAYHVYRGMDDIDGGIAIISEVKINERLGIGHINGIFIAVEQSPSAKYNYKILLEKQDRLKKEYGNAIARPAPDNRAEFNQENADWTQI